jgi:hypothetical protein
MPSHNKILALGSVSLFVLFGMMAAKPPQEEKPEYKNLQVLSKNISDNDMDFVMESFSTNLGVNCMFCHVHYEKGLVYSFDYASDSLRNKRIARDMLKMTMKLNKKYFNTKLNSLMTTRSRFWCKTCHQGKPVPIFTR